jgi:hypothetical protein
MLNTKRDQYPWSGLERFGPFSRSWFSKRSPFILLICPEQVQGPSEQFCRLFRDGVTSVPGSKYSGGFSKVFSLVEIKHDVVKVPLAKAGTQIGQPTERPSLIFSPARTPSQMRQLSLSKTSMRICRRGIIPIWHRRRCY